MGVLSYGKAVTPLVTPGRDMRARVLQFEERTGLVPEEAAAVLGFSNSGYGKIRREERGLAKYVEFHMDTLERLSPRALAYLKIARFNGGKAHG